MCGVDRSKIDRLTRDSVYDYGLFQLQHFRLNHNVPNFGYKIYMNGEKIFYATDTGNLDGIEAKDFDMYFIEANYEDEEIQKRIADKEAKGEYAYERDVLKNHLSLAQCDDFLIRNMGRNSRYIYMHGHIDKE